MQINRFFSLSSQVRFTPKKTSDLDLIPKNHREFVSVLKDLYPGSHDKVYMDWLHEVRSAPTSVGSIYPVKYNFEHHKTWKIAYTKIEEVQRLYASEAHLENLNELQTNGIFTKEKIPNFNDINKFLQKRTGFKLINIGGMINSRVFLNALAFGVFYASQYIRHRQSPYYSVEPDVVHELMGHVPMFADEKFAAFSREIGKLSLMATDEELIDIAKVYFFSIEFGVMNNKIFGAALLSSPNETEHLIGNPDKIKPWKLSDVLKYEIDYELYQYQYADIQSLIYLKDIFEELKRHLRVRN